MSIAYSRHQTTHKIKITQKLLGYSESVARDLQQAIGLREPWTSMRSYLEPSSRLNYVKSVENLLGIDLRKARVLEIGSGMGLFIVVCRLLGINIVGIEPGANSYQNLHFGIKELLQSNGLPSGIISEDSGENLPWDDNFFDVVVGFQVLEHVADPITTLREAIRVLKPGGKIYMDVPNHFSFIEGHFGIPWLPFYALNKKLAKHYVKLLGMNPQFLDELNLITPKKLSVWTKELGAEFSMHMSGCCIYPSSSDINVKFESVFPQDFCWKTGQRLSFIGRKIKQIINSKLLRPVLWKYGMTDHIILVGVKH